MAAEAVGVTVARREVTIQSAWDEATAMHPLAVHFCSVKCNDNYMAELFAPDSAAEESVIERTAETVVERRGPTVQRVVTNVKKTQPAPQEACGLIGQRAHQGNWRAGDALLWGFC